MAKNTPPELSLEVINGANDGLDYQGCGPEINIGREKSSRSQSPNDFSLQDNYSSRDHSRVFLEDGVWRLADRGSQNSTIFKGAQLTKESPAEPLEDGDCFVVGISVIRFSHPAGQRPALSPGEPPPRSKAAETLLSRASQRKPTSQIPYVGVEHLFAAIATSRTPVLSEFFSAAAIEPAAWIDGIRRFKPWIGELAWVAGEVPPGKSISVSKAALENPAFTPRLNFVLHLAADIQGRAGADKLEAIHLLAALLEEGGGIPSRVLPELGCDGGELAQLALRLAGVGVQAGQGPETGAEAAPRGVELTPPPPAKASEVMAEAASVRSVKEAPPTKAEAPPTKAKEKPRRERPVSRETWLAATALLQELRELQIRYHLAGAESRLDSLQAKITEDLSRLPEAQREEVRQQLRRLLPVMDEAGAPTAAPPSAPPPPTAPSFFDDPAPEKPSKAMSISQLPLDGLEKTVLESTLAPSDIDISNTSFQRTDSAAKTADGAELPKETAQGLWRILLAEGGARNDRRAQAPESTEEANQLLLKLTEIFYQYTLKSEEFMKGLLATLYGGRSGDSFISMRGWATDLNQLVDEAVAGAAEAAEADNGEAAVAKIQKYLNDVNHWQTAVVMAYQESFNRYNEITWKRFSPKAIARNVSVPRGMKLLGGEKGRYWEAYEEMAADLSPDLAKDEYRMLLDRLVNEIFKQLNAR